MQRLLTVRIFRIEAKFAYVIAFVLGGVVLARFVPVVGSVLADVVQLAAVWYGARVFRGAGEPIAPARAWWRMTAWRRASFWIGASAVFALAWSLLTELLSRLDPERYGVYGASGSGIVPTVSVTVFWAAVAFLYLNSWVRLRRSGIHKPPPLPPIGPSVIAKSKSKLP